MMSSLFVYAQQDTVSTSYSIDDVIVATRQQAVSLPDEHGNISLNMEALHIMPRIGGSVNVLKLLQYTPGVAAVEEGNTAMYVRGSDGGQCITLLDDAPIYSPFHLMGIFSIFNSAHISGMTLYKSGVPAMYGSSSSSILAVRTHRTIPTKTQVAANIGLIESDVAIQFPVSRKFALFVTARHSYASWLAKRLSDEKTSMGYEFGDYGVGFVADIGRAGRLTMNTHFNDDNAKLNLSMYNSDGRLNWWNALASLSLETPIDEDVSLTNTLYGSLYDNSLRLGITSSHISVSSKVQDFGFKSVADFNVGALDFSAGINYSFRRILPQDIKLLNLTNSSAIPFDNHHEAAMFANVEWRENDHIEVEAGLRLSMYNNRRLWLYPEPRVMLSVPINSSTRFWAGYNRMVQYVLLVPQSNMSFATDFYVGASENTPPQSSHNFSLGYSQTAVYNTLSWSAELFYRQMKNAIEYESNMLTLVNSDNKAAKFYCGEGEAYGLETSVGYNDNMFDIQLSYTLSKSVRQFDGLNGGIAFVANSDRRHNISLMASCKFSPRWTLSTSFVYATGAPYTATKALYISGNAVLRELGPYNGARLPDLHHLDISATYWLKSRNLKYSGINISIYNVYAHTNPAMLSWDVEVNEDKTMQVNERYHKLYTILPSVSWVVKF